MSSLKCPKGTRDFYPESQALQNFIFDQWKKNCKEYGYQEYEGPIFEHLELFTGKSGDEIVSQLYNFQDKSGRDLALRPEMTPTLARLVNQKGRALSKPFKWFSIPRLFRYEKAQKGRLREFFQLNMDIIGTESLNAEVDLLLSIVSMLTGFGLEKGDFKIGVSNRRLLSALLQQQGIENEAAVFSALDKRAKVGADAFSKLLNEAGLDEINIEFFNKFMECSSLEQLAEYAKSKDAQAALDELKYVLEIFENLEMSGYIAIDLSVVRGLAYYTGVIFEVFDSNKNMRAIAGGGRYDNLCAQLGGEKVTGVGFGVGDVVLADLLTEKKLLPESLGEDIDCFLLSFEDKPVELFNVALKLRAAGIKCTHSLQFQKFKKQMDSANKVGAKKVIFVGSEKAGEGEFDVKNLSTGEQSVISLQQLQEELYVK